MRAVIIIIILAVIAFLAYTFVLSPQSEEEKMVRALEDEFDTAVGNFLRSGRTMAGTGLDTTSDIQDAVRTIKKVERELKDLKNQLTEESAQKKAEKLEEKIKEFVKKNEIEEY
jgi:LPS O-antigen subunit length determinant protein (WzzB/FepE family)